jgi:hypothetical protein
VLSRRVGCELCSIDASPTTPLKSATSYSFSSSFAGSANIRVEMGTPSLRRLLTHFTSSNSATASGFVPTPTGRAFRMLLPLLTAHGVSSFSFSRTHLITSLHLDAKTTTLCLVLKYFFFSLYASTARATVKLRRQPTVAGFDPCLG